MSIDKVSRIKCKALPSKPRPDVIYETPSGVYYGGKLMVGGDGGPRIRIVAAHGSVCSTGGSEPATIASNGTTQVSATVEHSFVMGASARDLRLLVCNGTQNSAGYIEGPGNAILIHACAMGNMGGNIIREIPFPGCTGAKISTDPNGGGLAYAIGSGSYAWSDPVNFTNMEKGKQLNYRLHVKVSAGEKWPLIPVSRHNVRGTFARTTDVVYRATAGDGSDWSNSAAAFSASYIFAANALTFGASAVIGEQLEPVPTVLHVGDSIDGGHTSSVYGRGYVALAATGKDMIVVNGALPGGNFSGYYLWGTLARELAGYVDHIYCGAGVNGWNTGVMTLVNDDTTTTGLRYTLIRFIRAMLRPGQTLTLATQLPFPNGTGAGSGPVAANDYTQQRRHNFDGVRLAINNWYRDAGPNGFVAWATARFPGIKFQVHDRCIGIEMTWDGATATPLVLPADGQQAAGVGGFIKTGTTADALHLNDAGEAIVAANMDPDVLFAL